MLQLAADCGEDPHRRDEDLALLPLLAYIHVAVGGHAGDDQSARFWAAAAEKSNTTVVLHPSLPDQENFGRRWWDIDWHELQTSLNRQRNVLPNCTHLKFHGALYNKAQDDILLAEQLALWMHNAGINVCTTLADGALAAAARQHDIRILAEGFLDRSYQSSPNGLRLVNRSAPNALRTESTQWHQRLRDYARSQALRTIDQQLCPITVDVWTLHTDHTTSTELIHSLKTLQKLQMETPLC